MTTNKPEVVGFATHHDEPMLLPSKGEATIYCDDGEEPVALIRLTDYEALQAECTQLRAAIRRLCNIYVVDDYYDGQMREDRLDEAVNRAINAVMETPDAP